MNWKQFVVVVSILPVMACAGLKPIVIDPTYEHDRWGTLPQDHIFTFAAYITSFDGDDDNNGDSDSDKWGIPEWVAYEIKGDRTDDPLTKRPKWMTDKELYEAGIAPSDKSYAVSGTRKLKEVKGDYRFVRGHMCPKDAAERVSSDAAYNTHTVLNAVPQLQWQNNGIWKDLEEQCVDWADQYGRIWVICGPVFFGKEPAMWLGQDGEKLVAIPDALFKIVIRESEASVETLCFVIPNILPKTKDDLSEHLTTISRLESLTGLEFFANLENGLSDDDLTSIKSDTGNLSEWGMER